MIDSRFYKSNAPFSLEKLPSIVNINLPENLDAYGRLIHGVSSLDEAGPDEVTHFHNPKYLDNLKTTQAGFCFVRKEYADYLPAGTIPLVTDFPYRSFGLFAQAFYPDVDRVFSFFEHPIHPDAVIGQNCIVEHGAIIHAGAVIGDNTHIGANTVIGKGVVIGSNCIIESGVTITYSIIGDCVTIFSGARIGQAGFGFFMDEKGHVKVPQLGRVMIEDDVEIGANTTIDRGSLHDTVIGKGCRIDNLVQIAHNVKLGRGCVIVAQVGIAGSTTLGNHVVLAGQTGIAGHLKIGNFVRAAAKTGITRDIPDGETVGGIPSVPINQWHRQTVALQKLVKRKEK